ncbi:MAG: 40S ribosomal protein S19 [Candidatus Woesearchaeota archaeon]
MRIIKDTNEIIEKLAVELKNHIVAPEWASFVKTGHGKDRPPVRSDWWYVRAASVLLKVQKLGPVGVSKLSVKYGTRKNRGVRPEKFTRGSRNILRKVLQQLEDKKFVKQAQAGVHKGRVLTTEGNRLIIEASK